MTSFTGFEEAAAEFEELADQFDEAADEVEPIVDRAVRHTAEEIRKTAFRNAPKRTRRLANSIGVRKGGSGLYFVGSDLEYARYVEFGRGPVTPTEADALRFEMNGETVFAQRVGPAEPQPFLRRAILRHEDSLVDRIEVYLDELFMEMM